MSTARTFQTRDEVLLALLAFLYAQAPVSAAGSRQQALRQRACSLKRLLAQISADQAELARQAQWIQNLVSAGAQLFSRQQPKQCTA